uniref:Protein kinase domain-containing protein n=1 Tax=Panagrolaimus sp. PS1159 TaxID=55785 RepID=A0AC35GLP8_9BILA
MAATGGTKNLSAEMKEAAAKAAQESGIVQTALDIVQLYKGDKVATWEIIKKLGEGGFGAVYLVKDANGKIAGEYALKAEKASETTRVLKMEVYVLMELKKSNAKHFCDILDRGRANGYNFVVMTLVGPSFDNLRKTASPDKAKQKFSLGCALSIGICVVDAIEELHGIGYLHRDIKPGNFAIGKSDPRRVIMLDFGMARKYIDAQGKVRVPRWAAGFRGTVRYAPLSCHISRDHCRKDDLESFLYMQ